MHPPVKQEPLLATFELRLKEQGPGRNFSYTGLRTLRSLKPFHKHQAGLPVRR